MARFRVRDKSDLRDRLAKSRRVVPHSVRSLAEQVEVSSALVGHLLTGERDTVDGKVAERISEELQAPFDDLFAPIECPIGHGHEESGGSSA